MFDIGFWELTVIAVIALIVLGPERLPGLARTAGMWFSKLRRFVSNVKADIDKELKADEIRRALEKEAGIGELKDVLDSTKSTLDQKIGDKEYIVKAIDDEPSAVPPVPTTNNKEPSATPSAAPAKSDEATGADEHKQQ